MKGLPALLLGGVTGLLSGLLGIGGGLVVGPSLALLGMPMGRALGTALWVVFPVATVAVLAELWLAPAQMLWWPALWIALGGQLGAPLGASILLRLPEYGLRYTFAFFLLWVGLRNLGFVGTETEGLQVSLLGLDSLGAFGLPLIAGTLGLVAGICSSLFGVGGGVIVVPGLLYLLSGFTFPAAAATSLLAMVPTAARGAWIARKQSRVDLPAIMGLVPSAIATTILAVWLRDFVIAPAVLTQIFGVFLLFVAWRVIRRNPA